MRASTTLLPPPSSLFTSLRLPLDPLSDTAPSPPLVVLHLFNSLTRFLYPDIPRDERFHDTYRMAALFLGSLKYL